MKNLLKYTLFVIAICTLASCNRDDSSNFPDGFGKEGYITLLFNGSELATKSTVEGVESYNENKIERVDCFFYPTGDTTKNAVLSALGRSVKLITSGTYAGYYEVEIRYSKSILEGLFGSASGGTCHVYAVANYIGTYGSSTAVDSIRYNTTLETDFTAPSDGIQSSFVMDGIGTATLQSGSITGTVMLDRAAAKVQLFANISAQATVVDTTVTPNVSTVWISDPTKVMVQLKKAVKKGRLNGSYSPSSEDYITYQRRTLTETITANWGNTSNVEFKTHMPFYSYPVSWYDIDPDECVFNISVPWRKQGESTWHTSYYQLSANRIERMLKRNTSYELFIQLSTVGSLNSLEPVIIKNNSYIIQDWGKVNIGEGTDNKYIPGEFKKYNYLVVEPTETSVYNRLTTNFFYSSSSDVTAVVTKVVYNNYSGISGTTTITKTSGLSDYGVQVDTDNSQIVYTHNQNSIYVQENIYITVTNSDPSPLSTEIVIHQYPAIYISKEPGSNVFVNGYFGYVLNPSNAFSANTRTLVDNSYYRCNKYTYGGKSYGYSSNSRLYAGQYSGTGASDYGTVLMGMNQSSLDASLKNTFITDIFVGAFNSTNYSYTVDGITTAYKIGDPRVTASSIYGSSWSLNQFLSGATSNSNPLFASWSNPENIMIASQSASDQNIISPKFIIASSYNAMVDISFDLAVHRAATYQENGYPAGRWRLPTEAEIAFIMARQNDGVIPVLFATGSSAQYWSASGRYYDVDSNTFITGDSSTRCSSRFVYDTWYWGSSPCSTKNAYLPNGHKTNYNY